jgi:hypothetical protein
VNAYPVLTATDDDNYLTINAFSTLGSRFSYFSLSNFGRRDRPGGEGRKDTFYTEQNIRFKIAPSSPFDLTAQFNFRSGDRNDRHRLGLRWRLNDTRGLQDFFRSINLSYAVNLHFLQFDHEDAYVVQLEHAFFMKFPALSDRLYLSGFMDHTFNQDLPEGFPGSPIVMEIQGGVRLFDRFHAIAEYRINDYRRGDVTNLALGVQYKVTW